MICYCLVVQFVVIERWKNLYFGNYVLSLKRSGYFQVHCGLSFQLFLVIYLYLLAITRNRGCIVTCCCGLSQFRICSGLNVWLVWHVCFGNLVSAFCKDAIISFSTVLQFIFIICSIWTLWCTSFVVEELEYLLHLWMIQALGAWYICQGSVLFDYRVNTCCHMVLANSLGLLWLYSRFWQNYLKNLVSVYCSGKEDHHSMSPHF